MSDTEPKAEPAPVSIENPEPIPVTVAGETLGEPVQSPTPVVPPVNVTVVTPVPPTLVAKSEGVVLAPKTTEAEDKIIEGQRRINIVWESVQAVIAISVTAAIIYLAIVQTPAETITNAFFLIVGFYFSRTNHERPSGVGIKPPEPPYVGR